MASYFDFNQKIVVITGGSNGIGQAIAEQFMQYGAKIVIADIDKKGESLAEQWMKAGHEAAFVSCDVSSFVQVRNLIRQVEEIFGGLDILVNNAGIFPRADLFSTDEAFWNNVLGINLKGAYLLCQAAVPIMSKQGGGSIVNIGSLHSTMGEEATLAYAVSKGGIETLTRNLARSLAKRGIRVNCVRPGWVASDGEVARLEATGLDSDSILNLGSKMPLGRMQNGQDIASAVTFMASELACQITGQILTVDGGAGLR